MSATTASRSAPAHGRLILVAVGLLVVVLVAGLVYAIRAAIRSGAGTATATDRGGLQVTGTDVNPQLRRDALAAAPMPALPPSAALPHSLLPRASGRAITFPASIDQRGLVPTGFPRTTAGALAQFAAIDAAALEGFNPSQVIQVYGDWSLPGAEPVALWSVSQLVNQTLGASGIPNGASTLRATFTVSEAQVKGVLDDGDFVLACVNGELDISYLEQTTRTGAADCARMVWSDGRWQIGPGSQPAVPASAWPGTAEAAQVGWKPVHHAT